jgi:CIC family chloride channel protein
MKTVSKFLNRYRVPETTVLGIAAMLSGLLTAMGVWIFKRLIDLAHIVFFDQIGGLIHPLGAWTILFVPVIGGLIVGWYSERFVKPERYHGVTAIIASTEFGDGKLAYQETPSKVLTAILSLGSGASVGPEDPSVQIGANLGSMFGQFFRVPSEHLRVLVAAGAAAGVAAAFNAPIAGVFFAIEIILGEIATSSLGVVLLASVTSAVFTQAISGAQPAFIVPAYEFQSVWELPLYLGLGLLAGPVSAIFVYLVYAARDLSHRVHWPAPIKGALAGLMVGVVAIYFNQVLGVGYETIAAVLNSQAFPIVVLLIFMVAKMILTPVSLGGGFHGGVFAPSLFVGAMLGGAYGAFVGAHVSGFPMASSSAYAMVGMAAVLAGATHAPLTAILLLFEMTRDYRIILPLMFAVVVSLLISRRLESNSVYLLGLARSGLTLTRERMKRVFLGGVEVTTVKIEAGAACVGVPISDLSLPRDCVLASVVRNNETIIPHGNTILADGDVLVFAALGPAREKVLALCQTKK